MGGNRGRPQTKKRKRNKKKNNEVKGKLMNWKTLETLDA